MATRYNSDTFQRLVQTHASEDAAPESPWVMLRECRATMGDDASDVDAVVSVIAANSGGVAVAFSGSEPPSGRQRVEWLSDGFSPCEMTVARSERIGDRLWRLDLVPVAAVA